LPELIILYDKYKSQMYNEYHCKSMIINELIIRFESIYDKVNENVIYFNEINIYIISGGILIPHKTEGTVFWFTQHPTLTVIIIIYYIFLCIKLR